MTDRTKGAPRVGIIALQTYDRPGGIQRFNQRLFGNLAAIFREDGAIARPWVLLKGDDPARFDRSLDVDFVEPNRPAKAFVRSAFAAVRRTDILLVGHINLLPLAVALKAARPSLRLFLIVHGDEVWDSEGYRRLRWYEPLLLRLVDRIVSVSGYTSRRMAEKFRVPPGKFFDFLNAVDLIPDRPRAAASERIALSVTRLTAGEERKNIQPLVTAFARVVARWPDAELHIIGEGVLKQGLIDHAASLGIAGSVVFRGYVDDEALEAAYARSTVFALPSDKEGFGIVYLEAWLRNVPVICSDLGAPATIIDDGVDGWVASRAVDDIAAALIAAFSDQAAADRMGRAGRRKVEEKYSNAAFRARLKQLVTG